MGGAEFELRVSVWRSYNNQTLEGMHTGELGTDGFSYYGLEDVTRSRRSDVARKGRREVQAPDGVCMVKNNFHYLDIRGFIRTEVQKSKCIEVEVERRALRSLKTCGQPVGGPYVNRTDVNP